MGAIELLFLLGLLLKAGSRFGGAAPGVPTASVPQAGPPVAPPRGGAVATAPPPGAPSTPAQAAAQTRAASAPAPFPQAVPAGLPAFPGPGWKPFVPTPAPVTTRAQQLLPVLWATGAGTRKTEQTAGQWTTYLATKMGNAGQIRGVTAWKLASAAPQLANA
jgi:hypothetical protein